MKILIDIKKNKNPSEPYRLKVTIPATGAKSTVCEMECNSLNGCLDAVINEITKRRQDIMEVALEEMKPKKPKKPEKPKSPPKSPKGKK